MAAFQHEHMGRATVEPDVEDVGYHLIVGGLIRVPQIFLRPRLFPGVDALGLDRGDDPRIDLMVDQQLAGLALDKYCDRNAPGALAAEHPVGAALDHRSDAVAALF